MATKGLFQRLSWWLLKREKVGADALGNSYYRKLEKQVDGTVREVRYAAFKDNVYDPQAMPPEWMQWMHRTRPEPPTAADIAAGRNAREEFQQRVQQAEAEEERRRAQEAAGAGARQAAPARQLGGHD